MPFAIRYYSITFANFNICCQLLTACTHYCPFCGYHGMVFIASYSPALYPVGLQLIFPPSFVLPDLKYHTSSSGLGRRRHQHLRSTPSQPSWRLLPSIKVFPLGRQHIRVMPPGVAVIGSISSSHPSAPFLPVDLSNHRRRHHVPCCMTAAIFCGTI